MTVAQIYHLERRHVTIVVEISFYELYKYVKSMFVRQKPGSARAISDITTETSNSLGLIHPNGKRGA